MLKINYVSANKYFSNLFLDWTLIGISIIYLLNYYKLVIKSQLDIKISNTK